MQKYGFTLIELLVVVLIIGILSAVAWPEYQVAVEKSRAANAIIAAKAVKDAEEIYFMANGQYTDDIRNLDLDVPVPKDFTLYLMKDGDRKVEFWRETAEFKYAILFSFDHREGGAAGIHYCAAYTAKPGSRRICSSYGPAFGTEDGWARYRMN